MIRSKRGDTLVGSVERLYGITANARADMKLATLLRERGFASQTEFPRAHRGCLDHHSASRSVFLSFHREDLRQVTGFRLMMSNERLALDISDEPNRVPVNSERSSYIKRALRERIAQVDVVVCMIGNRTAWRDWVEWELETAYSLRRGICGVRLKGSRGQAPALLRDLGGPVARWDIPKIVSAIECAAARRT